ncbi:MAG: hypothetical protein II306_06415 [Clostridia bacterium]|nr:hypothetical protein [Clostridia bacterium]
MNNYQKIKAMSIDEMAECLHKIDKAMYIGATNTLKRIGIELTGFNPVRSINGIKQWLESEEE